MFNKLREITDIKNIRNTLSGCAKAKAIFFIWYKVNDERVKSSLNLVDVNFDSKIIGLFESKIIPRDQLNVEIFLYHEEFKILFKGIINSFEEDLVHIEIIPKIFIEEKRERKRFYFKKIDVIVKIEIKTSEFSSKEFVNLDNISETGMCFDIPLEDKIKYKHSMEISLLKIEAIKLPNKILGTIVHMTDVKNQKGDELVKIGVKFNQTNPIISEVMLIMENS